MKILILNHNQENLGTYFRCFNFGKELSHLKHQIIMICASGKKFDLSIRKKKINDNFFLLTLPRICWHRYFTGQGLLRLPLTSFLVLILKYDFIYAFTVAQPQIAIPAILSKIIRNKKLVIDWDDLWGGGFGLVHGKLINSILGFFEEKTLLLADKITYVSKLIGKRIEKLGLIEKSQLVPNGANVKKIKPINKQRAKKVLKLNKKERYLVSIGNTYTTSLKILINAFKKILLKESNLSLILVGSAKIPNKLVSPLVGKVIVTGVKPYQKIPLYLGAADILVLPMENNLIEKARFPIRFGDYLCSKRPIVSNAIGEIKYYLEKYQAGYITKSTEKSLASGIIKILNNPRLGNKLADNAWKLPKSKLSWGKIGKNLNQWLLKV
ncbi:hypothetical protein COT75_05030 [Candidatus Beckwithbacteria bacterium CG10_big_fil_rev_8_21_14_0_10_34_10]|uniref:Glycosyl transferase family 1 domain-containing protein n=1 Tax=Candidatus Beckwithbacteria bacterium CG10_big_fil_rev_8_21_14_0_10_34_10 TaxID=1974495 RepID=A0A2H0W814_9BACT|nr:MAG: hypothetical protein COT75_05030 [Candidatus Beckwithbacteria bacterium CG10_big_fil_rev_8_21_14_0_10_34_10]